MKTFFRIGQLALIISMALLAFGCAGTTQTVTRVDPATIADLSGKWNDTDSRKVSDEMIADCLGGVWLKSFLKASGKEPVVVVGQVRNLSHEHISENTFIMDMERVFVNSGEVTVVQGGVMRDEIREERADQQEFATAETRKAFRRETGADYILTGSIDSIVDKVEGAKVVFYQVNLELVDIETNKKVWIGDKKIKKIVERGRATY